MRIWLILRIAPLSIGGPSAEETTKKGQLLLFGNDAHTDLGGVQPSAFQERSFN